MKEMKLSANEMAEIIGRLSNSAGSMESYDGREKTIALAKKLYAKCAEEGINLYAYDEQRYLGKVYKIHPSDEHLFGYWHKWTAEDIHYENPEYTEYDRLYVEDKTSIDEVRLNLLKSIKLEVLSNELVVMLSRKLGDRTYSYKIIFENGFKVIGPLDEFGNEVESDKCIARHLILDDIVKIIANAVDGLPLRDYEIEPVVRNAIDDEIKKIFERLEEENRRQWMNNLNSFLMSNGTIKRH